MDYNLNNITELYLETIYDENIFYKAIHLYENVGVFLYYYNSTEKLKIHLYNFNITDLSFSSINYIELINDGYSNRIEKNDLIKLDIKTFCYITVSNDNKNLKIFIFNNIIDQKIILRKYILNIYEKNQLLFGQELKMTFYNDFIALTTVAFINDFIISYPYLMIFSYPNSTDFNIDITQTLKSFKNPIINFNEKCKIENNIFGYEFVGIKLIELYNGIQLLNEDDKSKILIGNIFNNNVELIINETIQLNSTIRIEYAMIVKDPPYDLYKNNSQIILHYCPNCDEEKYYEQKYHIGRISYCDIIIDLNEISQICDDNCYLCKKDNQECIFCINYFSKLKFDNKKCTNETIECPLEAILNNKCSEGKITLNQIDEIKNKLFEDFKGENTVIETESVIIQLSKLEDQLKHNNPNISNINLGECENILKQSNNFENNDDLIIYKIDVKTSDASSSYITYEVYDSNLNKLNMEVCSDVQISINVPVKFDESIDNLAQSLINSGHNLFNENDSFYNDICSTYTSENGMDMTLSDRKKEIYTSVQNKSICQSDCELESYNTTTKKAKCNCDITTSSTLTSLNIDNCFNKKQIAESFYKTLMNSNFLVMKCFNLILDFSNFCKNYGEIIMTILFLFFLVMMIIYFILGNKQVHNYLVKILKMNYQKNVDNNNNKIQNIINKFDEQNTINSEDKKIVIKHIKIRKQPFHKKKNKFSSVKAPPKKRRMNSDLHSVISYNMGKRKRNSQIIPSINHFYENKSETLEVVLGNKKYKKKREDNMSNFTLPTKDIKIVSQETEVNINSIYNLENKNNKYTDNELDDLDFGEAIIYDKRTYLQYYWSLLRKNQLIIFTFFSMNDYNIIYAKIALFIFSFGFFFTINGFFFSDETMHKIYMDNGNYDILYQIPQIFYSSIISSLANIVLKNLSLSENNILDLQSETHDNLSITKKRARKIENCIRIKLTLFFIISLILMLFCWYFISCFCAVYKNTQIILIKDTGVSFGASLVYPFVLSFIPGLFRITALRLKNKKLKFLFIISNVLNWFI